MPQTTTERAHCAGDMLGPRVDVSHGPTRNGFTKRLLFIQIDRPAYSGTDVRRVIDRP